MIILTISYGLKQNFCFHRFFYRNRSPVTAFCGFYLPNTCQHSFGTRPLYCHLSNIFIFPIKWSPFILFWIFTSYLNLLDTHLFWSFWASPRHFPLTFVYFVYAEEKTKVSLFQNSPSWKRHQATNTEHTLIKTLQVKNSICQSWRLLSKDWRGRTQ